jgi:hypothetical protein
MHACSLEVLLLEIEIWFIKALLSTPEMHTTFLSNTSLFSPAFLSNEWCSVHSRPPSFMNPASFPCIPFQNSKSEKNRNEQASKQTSRSLDPIRAVRITSQHITTTEAAKNPMEETPLQPHSSSQDRTLALYSLVFPTELYTPSTFSPPSPNIFFSSLPEKRKNINIHIIPHPILIVFNRVVSFSGLDFAVIGI